jgi:transmembrane sensor
MSDPNPVTTNTLDEAAAQWLARRDRGLTPAEQDAYLQWLRSDTRHGAAITRLEKAWHALDVLTRWQPEHSAQPNPDLLAVRRRRSPWVVPAWLSAAAVVAIGFFLYQARPDENEPAPGAAQLAQTYERRALADGSVIEINRGALVEVDYSDAERSVRLVQGEAHFTVAKDALRPFVVQAGQVKIRALGTVFNVRLEPERVEVLVTEGRVRVDPPAASSPTVEPPLLEAGQRAIITLHDAVLQSIVAQVDADEIAATLAWQPRWLEFADAPLIEVLVEFNRQGGPRLVLADPELARLRVGGSFRADNADGFVRLLESGFGVQAERTATRTILRKAP